MDPILTALDVVALFWFFIFWVGYTLVADSERLQHKSVAGIMNEHRNAMFASTSLGAVGGLVAALGATDKAIAILSPLPFVGGMSRIEWEIKMLLLLLIFAFAFFKFVWAYRLNTYCAVLVGAVPDNENIDTEAENEARRAAKIANLAARHFNRGIRAFYFALAALSWIIHPMALILSTTWVIVVLYRRDFRSRSQQIIRGT